MTSDQPSPLTSPAGATENPSRASFSSPEAVHAGLVATESIDTSGGAAAQPGAASRRAIRRADWTAWRVMVDSPYPGESESVAPSCHGGRRRGFSAPSHRPRADAWAFA